MSNFFEKAKRSDVKIKLAIAGPAGSGKTLSALKVARGLVGPEGKIAVCDTEKGSAKLYCTETDFFHVTMNEPHTVDKYLKSIEEAEAAGMDVLILDTISHEWKQLLVEKELLDGSGKGNKFQNWAPISEKHERFVNGILQANIHIIATMRSKTAYATEQDDKGRITKVSKVGLDPVQREGIDYEFTVVLDMAKNNSAEATKDRTGLFKGRVFVPSEETGIVLKDWLKAGK